MDISICETCGGAVKIIADASDRRIEDPVVINFSHTKLCPMNMGGKAQLTLDF